MDPRDINSLIGRYDQVMYGDLLKQFGPEGPMSNEYLRSITNDTRRNLSSAGHQARNDAVGTSYQVRPPKP